MNITLACFRHFQTKAFYIFHAPDEGLVIRVLKHSSEISYSFFFANICVCLFGGGGGAWFMMTIGGNCP